MGAFVGIDYDSSAIHLSAIDENTGLILETKRLDLAGGNADAFDRARRVRDLMPSRGAWETTLAVGIELPFTRQLNSLVAQIRVQGAILACLPPAPLMVLDLRPQRWKRIVLGDGRGNADKAAVRAWALQHGAPAGLEEDFYDAFAIAHATRSEWETAHRRRTAQQKGAP